MTDASVTAGRRPPPTPTGLSARPIPATWSGATQPEVVLHWNPAVARTSSFGVWRDGTLLGVVTTDSFIDKTVKPGQTYVYGVDARNSAGASAQSTPVTITVPGPPPPVPVGLTPRSVTATSCSLSWQPSTGATSYTVYANGVAMIPIPGTALNLVGLSPGTAYSFTVAASNAFGSSAQSAQSPLSSIFTLLVGMIEVPAAMTPAPPPPADAYWITDFGAVSGPQHDSTAAIVAAVAAAEAHPSGSRTVYTPPGLFFTLFDPGFGNPQVQNAGTVPVTFLGAGPDVSRIVGMAPLRTTLISQEVAGGVVDHLTVDTAWNNGGVALAAHANGCHWQSIGACTGQQFGIRWVGKGTAHIRDLSADDVFLDGGNQVQAWAGGYTADWDIDFVDHYTVTNVKHRGGYLAPYFDGQPGGGAALASVIDGYDYTPTARAAPSIWHGIYGGKHDLTFRRITVHQDASLGLNNVGLRISAENPANPASDSGSNITFDQVTMDPGTVLQLGDVNPGLLVENCTLDKVVLDPTYALVGAFVNTTKTSLAEHPAPGAVISVTGL